MKTSLTVLLVGLFLGACTSTPAILDDSGQPLPGSLAKLESVTLNGRVEWITLRARDVQKPLLVFFSGGPGGSELVTIRETLKTLEDHFLVVVWDQPGAGKSFDAISHRNLTVQTYVDDACALVEQLCRRFDREQALIIGESWGSYLAILTARAIPQRISLVVGTGQMVAFLENDIACWQLALEWARSRGDHTKVEELVRIGPPPYQGPGVASKLAAFLPETFSYMKQVRGVRTQSNTIRDLMGSEYTPLDRINWFRGLWESLEWFYPQLWASDLRKEVPRLEVPFVVFMGRHDVNASIPLMEDYLVHLEAPRKEVIWFEHSGHTPWSSEPSRFVEELVAQQKRLSRWPAEDRPNLANRPVPN